MEDKTMSVLTVADVLRRVINEGETQSGLIAYTNLNSILRTSK